MAVNEEALKVIAEADTRVRETLGVFMRVRKITQAQLGEHLGMSQTQVARRLNVPGALSASELAAMAAFFQVEIATFLKPLPEALSDLGKAQLTCTGTRAA